MAEATYYEADSGVLIERELEVPSASFANGMNAGGFNSPGIGINIDGGELADAATDPAGWNWTLLDQDGDARTPQVGQPLGGLALTQPIDWPGSGGLEGKGVVGIKVGGPADDSGDGTALSTGDATLTDLATGWTAVVVP